MRWLGPVPLIGATMLAGFVPGSGLVMGPMGALGSSAGGMILGLWGFTTLNVVGAALVLAPLAVTLLRRLTLVSAPTPEG